jgi:hypothetical protein
MKYLTFVRHTEAYRKGDGPPPALFQAMGEFVQRSRADGTLVDTGGLMPSKDGFKIRLANGKMTVIDGPFTESKEVIGGWAILQATSREQVMRIANDFMELHRKHWPEFEGECEVRPMAEMGAHP